MATVTFIQPIDMSTVPATISATGTFYTSVGELDLIDATLGISVYALGDLTLGGFGGVQIQGTVTRVFIDNGDSLAAPNLEISGLSFGVSTDLFSVATQLSQFMTNLLAGDDTFIGSKGGETALGYGGNDTFFGSPGSDVFFGGSDSDTVTYANASAGVAAFLDESQFNQGDALGDSYNSIENLIGSPFGDTLYGNAGANKLSGGAGNDFLAGKAGGDRLDGGTGTDTVSYNISFVGVRADLMTPSTNTNDADGDIYTSIENLDGSSFSDTLLGNNSANIIRGSSFPNNPPSGNDKLFGRGGNDQLFGFDGIDTLTGGTGRDLMTGGADHDIFDFNSVSEMGKTSSTRDVIKDFVHGTDDIDVSTIDANGSASGNTAFHYVGTHAFSGVAGQVRWFQQNLSGTANDKTIIEGDINGDQIADFQIQLAGLKTLTSSDFIL